MRVGESVHSSLEESPVLEPRPGSGRCSQTEGEGHEEM